MCLITGFCVRKGECVCNGGFVLVKESVCVRLSALGGGSGRQIESSLLERGTMRPQPLSCLHFSHLLLSFPCSLFQKWEYLNFYSYFPLL